MADPVPVQSNDNYQAYLSDKLWNMVPAIYRTLDTDKFNANGPLREMVNRIGASAAVLRRSIDRLWEDQSIETCDDWVIAYIGDLLATNLVDSLDARGQRLDVAKTVYYRQRKGTLAVLEEIAADITGWDARVVEFFRRMGRTRHSFDPPIGLSVSGPTAASQLAAIGDGATTAFPAIVLLNTPIYKGTLQVVQGDLAIGVDNGSGLITGTGGSGLTGTVDYTSGALALDFVTAPSGGTAITVTYNYLGFDNSLQVAEGLVGPLTGSSIGGWADLRNVYGAAKAQTAFDEFSHTADLRLGVDRTGWQNISHLGVFLWRLHSFPADNGTLVLNTPVASTKCPGQYCFDPTGRMVPLFAAASRSSMSYGDNWVSPQEWQLPGPISLELMQLALQDPQAVPLYATAVDTAATYSVTPNSLGVYTLAGSDYLPVDPSCFLNADQQTTIYPEYGTFQVVTPALGSAPAPPYLVSYNYGFSSTIGAGPYDRQLPGVAQPIPLSVPISVSSGAAIADPGPNGWIVIQDSFTYSSIADIGSIASPATIHVTIQAAAKQRPVLRWPASTGGADQWTFSGAAGSTLLLDGLLISGADIVIAGAFDSVILRCCTLDPGNAAGGSADLESTSPDLYAQSVDGRDLIPTRLWIEGAVTTLTLDRCLTGPVRTRMGGNVETLAVNDCIIQGIPTSDLTQPLTVDDLQDPADLALALVSAADPSDGFANYLYGQLSAATQAALQSWKSGGETGTVPATDIVADLNTVVQSPFYSALLFAGIALSPSTFQMAQSPVSGAQLNVLNRLLLEEAFPVALAEAALALASGEAGLSRTTVMGRTFVHRIEASECILDDFTVVEDTQNGCVRFSAWPAGSIVPRQYESVQIAAQSPIFTSREFGQPGYGQLMASADLGIVSGGGTVLEGAGQGTEMGAFAREKNPIKANSILIKYQEYMPLGLAPVLIPVT